MGMFHYVIYTFHEEKLILTLVKIKITPTILTLLNL